jgi:two-component system phosphate regulon response regulator PhoB
LANATQEREDQVRVLLVDDDPAIRAIYGVQLRADGFDVSYAEDGEQALLAAADRPAMILLDLRMPALNGLEVLDRLKGSSQTAAIPVVMLSNEGDPAMMEACARTGAADWWRKCAVTPPELSRRVRQVLATGV